MFDKILVVAVTFGLIAVVFIAIKWLWDKLE